MSDAAQASTRLFLSADIIGSTAKKQAATDTRQWAQNLFSFYQQFPRIFMEEYGPEDPVPELWKAVGDELIYTIEIKKEDDADRAVCAWIRAIRRFTSPKFPDGAGSDDVVIFEDKQVLLKGGAWTATFPSPNVVAAVPTDADWDGESGEPTADNTHLLAQVAEDGTKGRVDYVGPSMDIGFRVTSMANGQQFTLSLELAWAISQSRLSASSNTNEPKIYFKGEVDLKGVWSGSPYPLFYMNLRDPSSDPMAFLIMEIANVNEAELSKVSRLGVEALRNQNLPFAIFLEEARDEQFKTMDEKLTRALGHLEEIEYGESLPMGDIDETTQ